MIARELKLVCYIEYRVLLMVSFYLCTVTSQNNEKWNNRDIQGLQTFPKFRNLSEKLKIFDLIWNMESFL